MRTAFSLFVFSVDPDVVREVTAAGVSGVIVDCEYRGKIARQAGYDTQINQYSIEHVRRVRAVTDKTILCRINGVGETTRAEIEQAIDCGADEILLPMVRTVAEVETALNIANGRCGVGIMVENMDAAMIADELAMLPICRAYVGLNDLSIDRKSPHIFTALADGTVECIRKAFNVPVGCMALTLPEKGYPIPCHLLMGELARLRCDFSILRRAFFADTEGEEKSRIVPRILEAMENAFFRTASEVEFDHQELLRAIAAWPSTSVQAPAKQKKRVTALRRAA
jgi:hypothetical protein